MCGCKWEPDTIPDDDDIDIPPTILYGKNYRRHRSIEQNAEKITDKRQVHHLMNEPFVGIKYSLLEGINRSAYYCLLAILLLNYSGLVGGDIAPQPNYDDTTGGGGGPGLSGGGVATVVGAKGSAESSSQSDSKTVSGDLGFVHAFIASLSVILVSELGDKTFFIAAIMAMRHPRLVVFTGAITALALMTILSGAFGLVATFIPRIYTYYISAALFALFGLKMLKDGYYMSASDGQEELEEVQSDLKKREDELLKSINGSGGSDQKNESSTESLSQPDDVREQSEVRDDGRPHYRPHQKRSTSSLQQQQQNNNIVPHKISSTKSLQTFGDERPPADNLPTRNSMNGLDGLDLNAIEMRPLNKRFEKETTTSSLVQDPESGSLRKQTRAKSAAYITTRILMQAFTMTFLAEWGDRSQITTVLLSTSEDVYGVIVGGILGHSLCTGLAVIGGRMIAQRISVRTVTLVGGAVFLLFAISALFISPDP